MLTSHGRRLSNLENRFVTRRRTFLNAGTSYVPTKAPIQETKRGIRRDEREREKMKSHCAVKLRTTVAALTVNRIAFKSL